MSQKLFSKVFSKLFSKLLSKYFSTFSICLLSISLLSIFFITLSAQSSFAQSFIDAPVVIKNASGVCTAEAEVCGDGVDQDCSGKDLLCSGNDKDLDGFTAKQDCDDSNRFIYPEIYTKCSGICGAGVKQCLRGGSFSACSCKPLCEVKGNGRCYYISKLTGSDSNPGTFDRPLKTYLGFQTYESRSDYPENHFKLNPGDIVYFMSGTYDENFTYQGRPKAMFLKYLNGTKKSPITLKAYPGAKAILSSKEKAAALDLQASSNVLIEGFEVTKAFGDGFKISDSNNIEIRNIWAHNIDGVDNHNSSAIEITGVHDSTVHHSILNDNYDRTAADTNGLRTENSRNMVIFGGSNIRVHHNVMFQSVPITSRQTGGCFTYKHSAFFEGYENQISEIDHNIFRNCFFTAAGSGSHRSRIHHNLILDSGPIVIKDHGGITHHRDNIIEYNTLINSGSVIYNPTERYSPIGELTFRNNLVLNKEDSTFQNNLLKVHSYGSNELYQKVVPTKLISFSNNCYYNSRGPVSFDLFSVNETESLGGIYNFLQWKSLGFDSNSVELNPRLNSEYRPENLECKNKGHLSGW